MRLILPDMSAGPPDNMIIFLKGRELDRIQKMAGMLHLATPVNHVLKPVLNHILETIDNFHTLPPVALRYEDRIFTNIVSSKTAAAFLILHQAKTAKMRPNPDTFAALLAKSNSQQKRDDLSCHGPNCYPET